MSKLLKEVYNSEFVGSLGQALSQKAQNFDVRLFHEGVFDNAWPEKELKARMRHITLCIHKELGLDYLAALDILKTIAPKYSGFKAMLFPDFVQVFGLEYWDESIAALEEFTKYSSAEFAVRPFITKDADKMMKQMYVWALDRNYHVRRLSSEGCRPRLPWASPIDVFKKDPSPIIPLLERLKDDKSDYVRRSVANNLNDIAKDNSFIAIELAKQWKGKSIELDRLVKHGMRTLLKSGDREVLKLFGYVPPSEIEINKFSVASATKIGGNLDFEVSVKFFEELESLRVEYAIDFVKANGSLSEKVFMLRDGKMVGDHFETRKAHGFKQLSTRRHYPGMHKLTLIVNGVRIVTEEFKLECA